MMVASNGRLPASLLRAIPWDRGEYVNVAVYDDVVRFGVAFRKKFGYYPSVTEGYRNLNTQKRYYKLYGKKRAAYPGTSQHGYGVAIDFGSGINRYNSPQYRWVKANAWRFGMEQYNPKRPSYEPWHWHFTKAPTLTVSASPKRKVPEMFVSIYGRTRHVLVFGNGKTVRISKTTYDELASMGIPAGAIPVDDLEVIMGLGG